MSNVVEYILKLKSGEFDSGIDRAERKAEGLNARMGSLARSVAGFVSAFAVGNYLNNAVTAWNESEQALGQLQATMKSTGGAVGVTTDAMVAQAKALQSLTTYDDDAIVGMQSVLATFTNIKQEIFTGAVPAILDLSTKMGQDLKSSAVQVGKALNDPIQGITALRRVGVNFSDEQEKVIKNLVETNRVAEAQSMILRELQVEFGGSAEAAALVGTGPMQQLRNEMGDVNEEVGKLTVELSKGLVPILKNTVIPALGAAAKWANENTIALGASIKAIAGFALASKAISATTGIMAAFGASAGTLAAVGGPIAILGAALVGTLAYGYDLVTKSAERAKNAMRLERQERNEAVKSTGESALKMMIRQGEAMGVSKEQTIALAKGYSDKAADKIISQQRAKKEEMTRLANEYRLQPEIYSKYMLAADEAEKKIQDAETQRGLFKRIKDGVKPGGVNAMGTAATGRTARDPMRTQATGSKAVTINVTIGDLIKQFTIHTTNMKEGAMKAKEQVAAALMGAVNDFQILAEK